MMLPAAFSTANGKIAFGYKELLQLVILALGVGSAWAGLAAKTGELAKSDTLLETKVASVKAETETKLALIETQVDADHDTLQDVKKDVQQLGKDVQDVKVSQGKMQESMQQQRLDTATILVELRQLNSKKPR